MGAYFIIEKKLELQIYYTAKIVDNQYLSENIYNEKKILMMIINTQIQSYFIFSIR